MYKISPFLVVRPSPVGSCGVWRVGERVHPVLCVRVLVVTAFPFPLSHFHLQGREKKFANLAKLQSGSARQKS